MRRMIFLKFGGQDVHLPKLIGAFILVAALLMFFKATADMYDSWDNLKAFESCMGKVGACDPGVGGNIWDVQDPCTADEWQSDYDSCRADLYDSTGVTLRSGQSELSTRQFWSALLSPIAGFFFWLAIVFLGWLLYNTGRLVLPVEETVKKMKEKK